MWAKKNGDILFYLGVASARHTATANVWMGKQCFIRLRKCLDWESGDKICYYSTNVQVATT